MPHKSPPPTALSIYTHLASARSVAFVSSDIAPALPSRVFSPRRKEDSPYSHPSSNQPVSAPFASMCRYYKHSVWRCAEKYNCQSLARDSDETPRRPQFVACKNAIDRARTAAELFTDLGAYPIETPFALACPGTLETIESPEEDKGKGSILVIGMYCPEHINQATDKMRISWEEGVQAALSDLPYENSKVENHVKMYGAQIKFVLQAYASCLLEKAVTTGQGETFRLIRKFQDHMMHRLIEIEIPNLFACQFCQDSALPPLSGLEKSKREPKAVWDLKANAMLDVKLKKAMQMCGTYGLEPFSENKFHAAWVYAAGKFLFDMADLTPAAQKATSSGASRFGRNTNMQMRLMDEVEAMIGPSRSAKRRARHPDTRDYPNIRTTDKTLVSHLFYDTSDDSWPDDSEDSNASDDDDDAVDPPPRPTHFSLKLRTMINPK